MSAVAGEMLDHLISGTAEESDQLVDACSLIVGRAGGVTRAGR